MGYKVKRILIYPDGVTEKQVYPTGWQPGANTVAYYPLTATTTVNDMSGNNNTLTNTGVVFGMYHGVDCAYCNKKTLYRSITNMPISNQDRTISIRVYDTEYTSLWQAIWGQGGSGSHFVLFQIGSDRDATNGTQLSTAGGGITVSEVFPLNIWTLLTCTYDSGVLTLYKNGSQYGTPLTANVNTGSGNFYISGWNSAGYETFSGYLSDCIIENKARTAQEIADYYNSTKSNYGIS